MVPRQKVKFQVKICKNKITIDSCLEMKNNPVFHETFPVRRVLLYIRWLSNKKTLL